MGRFALVAKIATGGMAEIWLARQAGPKGFEKVVVIKKVSDAYAEDPEFVEMFLDEARIAAQLSHPNIVQIYDLGEEAGAYYIAMEYLAGENLSAIVRAGKKAGHPLPLSLAVRLIAAAADALHHAHTKVGLDGKPLQIVHRDVSPQNLLVTYDGALKVLDFGIAKAANRGSHTQGNQLKGKVSYLSPEQARGQPVDGRSDVFALGIVLFELVTGGRLFQFDDPVRALTVIGASGPLPSARSRNPNLPASLDAIIARALEREVKARYQSARELQMALEGWLRTQPDAVHSADVGAYMQLLFADRMAERAHLFEQAQHGELTPSRVRSGVLANSQRSMPGATSKTAQLTRRRRSITLAAVLALFALGTLGGLIWKASTPPEPAVLEVTTDPPGAEIATDGREQGTSPLSVALPPGAHQLSAALNGYSRADRNVTVGSGDRDKVTLTLVKVPGPATPKPATAPAAEPVHREPVRRGRLSFDTQPWTRVSLNGKVLGDTPLLEVPLPAGRHLLQLVNESKGIKSSVEVEVSPGQTTVKRLKL